MVKILQGMKRVTGQYMAGFAMLLLISMGAVVPAGAATINVTANAPDVTNGVDGICTLREAIFNINNAFDSSPDCAAAGTYGTNDTINLPAGTYTTAIVNPAFPAAEEDGNANGDLDIRKSVTINGAGAATTIINANGFLTSDRVFDINPQRSAGVAVSISGVTISWGATLFNGGGIRNAGTLTLTDSIITKNSAQFSGTFQAGGGIFSSTGSILRVTNSTISGNVAQGPGGGVYTTKASFTNSTISGNTTGSSGGGILNQGLVVIISSTISGNHATTDGGGINNNLAILSIANSTISGNSANFGGGIFNFGAVGSTVTINNTTITNNSAAAGGGGGGIQGNGGGMVFLKNTIVANQAVGGDCNASVTSTLNDLDSDGSCGVGALSNMNPLLGPLANYGGSTKTHALLPGSAAIDAGDATTCATAPVNGADQRGVTRPQGAGCDIGAFELGPLPVVGLSLNKSSFVTGNTMILTASTTPGSTPTHADVYIAKQLPDGTLLVMQPGGSFSTARTPLLSNILVPSFNGPIITSTFTGAETVGNYTWFAAFTQPGTMNIIGTLATAPFTFGP